MSASNTTFTGPMPEFYDRHLGPVVFEPYAADLARRIAPHANGPILEVACGTGIVTRELRSHLSPNIRLVATDLDQWMLGYAQQQLGDASNIEWQQADVTALPFPNDCFAAAACQFGVMFFDKMAAFREMRRVLMPGGFLAFNFWDCQAENPFARIANETVASVFDADPPPFYTIAFGGDDWLKIRQQLTASGFEEIRIEAVPLEARCQDVRWFAEGLVHGMPVSDVMRARGIPLAPVIDSIASRLARIGGDSPFRSVMQAVVVTARAA
jgi:SAM-dependent methyltransferase